MSSSGLSSFGRNSPALGNPAAIALLLPVIVFTLGMIPADPPPPSRELVDPKMMVSLADDLFAEEKWQEASTLYRKALFIRPAEKKALRGWQKIQKIRAQEVADQAVEAFVDDPRRGHRLLRQAATLHAKNSTVKKLLREHKYQEFRGLWRTKAEIAEFKEKLEEIERNRKRDINVSSEMAVIYLGPFRFFTDVDTRQAKSTLNQMTASVESHWKTYREVMLPFELQTVSDLDVVLFQTQAEYMRAAGIPGSAGVYYSGRGAGYFFGEGGWNFSTMLHEMTHQLNDKLMQAHSVEAWFEEGIAEYFGSGQLTQGGRRMQVGRVDAYRLKDFQSAVRGIEGRVIPLQRFLTYARAELSGEFYAQAWALAHFLMEVHPYGRAILFDYIEGHRTMRGRELTDVLERYKLPFRTFETQFLEYYRTGSASN